VGHRDPGVGGRCHARGHARDDLEAHPRRGERLRLLAAAPEHERVAALQAHDALPGPAQLDELRVDLVLLDGRAAGLLADVAQLGAGARTIERPGRDQPVVKHDVGACDQLQGAARHQPGVARAGADEVHDAALHARKR
jgi:hypothetical protein